MICISLEPKRHNINVCGVAHTCCSLVLVPSIWVLLSILFCLCLCLRLNIIWICINFTLYLISFLYSFFSFYYPTVELEWCARISLKKQVNIIKTIGYDGANPPNFTRKNWKVRKIQEKKTNITIWRHNTVRELGV